MNYNSSKPENIEYRARVFIPDDDKDKERTAYFMRQAKEEILKKLFDILWVNHWFAVRVTQRVEDGIDENSFRQHPIYGKNVTFSFEIGEVVERTVFTPKFEQTDLFLHQPDKQPGLLKRLLKRARAFVSVAKKDVK